MKSLKTSLDDINSLYLSINESKLPMDLPKGDNKVEMPKQKTKKADNTDVDVIHPEDFSDKESDENLFKPKKNSQKLEKTKKESVSISVMNDFDKICEQAIAGAEDFDELEALDTETEYDDGSESDAGDETVTINISASHVEILLDILSQIEAQVDDGEDGDDIEDLDDEFGDMGGFEAGDLGDEEDEDEDEDFLKEKLDMKKCPDSKAKMQGSNLVNSKIKPNSGSASTDSSGEVDGGKLKAANKSISELIKGKTVKGDKGGADSAFAK